MGVHILCQVIKGLRANLVKRMSTNITGNVAREGILCHDDLSVGCLRRMLLLVEEKELCHNVTARGQAIRQSRCV